jgi:carboxypeptidase C (cathepsin A)
MAAPRILGPQRVATDEMGNSPPPPYALVDNEHTLLFESDLVFIDPVGTGHSRMVEGEKVAEFHEYQRDLDAVGEFIRVYLARYGRWGSPKYLIGESYGTTRAAGLSRHLQEKHDIFLNGVMLVSLAVDLQTLSFDPGNELPYPLFLPTYAATAWYHKVLAPDLLKKPLREVIASAEAFANDEYSVALLQGSRLPAAKREHIAWQLARFSGLSVEFVRRCDLRPDEWRFFKELLRDRGVTVGRLDTRFLGQDKDDARRAARRGSRDGQPDRRVRCRHQPGAEGQAQIRQRRTVCRARAALGQLGLEGFREQIRERRRKSPPRDARQSAHACVRGKRVLRSWHAARRRGLHGEPPRPARTMQKNVTVSYFEAGHMMYIHQPSLARMAKELKAFVAAK